MKMTISYKLRSAVEVASFLPGSNGAVYPKDEAQRTMLYAYLADMGYVWSVSAQRWQPRIYQRRQPENRPIVKENSFVLVRIMARKEFIERDRDNYALALEAIGYEVITISDMEKNAENGFYRIYIKARAG